MEQYDGIAICTLRGKCPVRTLSDVDYAIKNRTKLDLEVAVDPKTATKLGLNCEERRNLECKISLQILHVKGERRDNGTYEVRLQIDSETLISHSEEKGKDAPQRRSGVYQGEFKPGEDAYISAGTSRFGHETEDEHVPMYHTAIHA